LAPWIAAIRAHADHVALLGAARFDQHQRFRAHPDRPAGAGDPVGLRLRRDVDHVRLAVGVEMGQLGHRRGSRGTNEAETIPMHDSDAPSPGASALHLRTRLVAALPDRAAPARLLRRGVACRCALAVALSGGDGAGGGAEQPPALGDSDSAEFNVGAERKIGDEIMREIRVDPDYIDDRCCSSTCSRSGIRWSWPAARLGNITADIDQRFTWQPFLVRDQTRQRAFALPGGYVGVHLGPDRHHGHRDELASVLGHEMSHVSQRHIARSVTGASKRSLVSLAALGSSA
jgi:hypothetical protein